MDKAHSDRQQPGPRTASAQSISHHDDENGLNGSMHGTRIRKHAPRGRNSSEKTKSAPMPPPKDDRPVSQRSIPTSTPTDPRKHRRTSSSFMEPTTASASRMVSFHHARPRERRPRPVKNFSQQLPAARDRVKAKIKAQEDSDILKSPVRGSNGVSKRRLPQRAMTKKQTSSNLTLEIRTRNSTIEQTVGTVQLFESEVGQHPQRDKLEEQESQFPPGWTQSSTEAAMRSRDQYTELHASHSLSADREMENSASLSLHFTPEISSRSLDQHNQLDAFRISSHSKDREREFRVPAHSSPDTSASEQSSSGTGKSSKSWFPSVSWGPSSPPKLNAEELLMENRRLQRSAYYLKEQNKQLNASLLQLKDVNNQHASELRMLQANSFKDIAKNVWTPLEDLVIRETMESVHKDIQDWAEENAAREFYDLDESDINEAEEEGLLRFLKEIALTSSNTVWDQFQIWEDQGIDPELILTAVATFYMYDRLFRNPFLILDAFETEPQNSNVKSAKPEGAMERFQTANETNDCPSDRSNDSSGEESDSEIGAEVNKKATNNGNENNENCEENQASVALSHSQTLSEEIVEQLDSQGLIGTAQTTSLIMLKTYGILMSLDREQAQLWRSQLMRILLPTPASGSRFEGLRPADKRINVFLRSYCSRQVDEFLLSPARILFGDDLIEESRSSLIDCWERTIHLFTQLQTQLRLVRWTAPDQERFAGRTFDEAAMEGHCTQAFMKKEGKPVSIAVSPALVLLGNEDGQGYDTKRVVVRAVVCVDE